ncbi:MAG: CCA tRNA nucleotidyltransferase [Acidobacteria bacterium]|nr:CCA tRNA nucleotidyltransferase [Acidobacteriota bacterium]
MPAPREPGRLRPDLAARVRTVARLAAEMGIEAWLVGGTVRDLLLGRGSPDLDFVAVGDGLGLAAALERDLGGRLLRHPEFLTAEVIDASGVHLDVATARQETYPAVAALPEVRPAAALDEDLWRRDFAVNAIALRLTAPGRDTSPGGRGIFDPGAQLDLAALAAAGALADPAGGLRDLAAAELRVLHQGSFLDDPTRVLRGVRFEARLGFRMAAGTEELARAAVAARAFARLGGGRLRHELELLLAAEPWPAAALDGLERLQGLGVLAAVHPRLTFDAAARRRLTEAAQEYAWHQAILSGSSGSAGSAGGPSARRWLLLLLALAAGLDEDERGELGARLLLAGDALRLLTGFGKRLAGALPRLGAGARPHEVDAALAGCEDEELLLLAAAGAPARSWVRRYLAELRPLALGIGGADLLAAGARRGPAIGSALQATRAARLDGEIGAGEELEFALARWREAAEDAGAAGR